MDWIALWVAAVRAAFPEPRQREIDDYLETFDADSAANRAARDKVWQALDAETQAELIALNRRENPQLFS